MNHENLSKIAKKEMMVGLHELEKVETPVCGSCQLKKKSQNSAQEYYGYPDQTTIRVVAH